MPTVPTLPPNPSLVALLLVIRTRSGPRSVFHYPSSPVPDPPSSAWHSHTSDSDTDSDSSTETGTVLSSDTRSGQNVTAIGSRGSTGARTDAGTIRTAITAASKGRSTGTVTTQTLREDGPEDEEEEEDELLASSVLDLSGSGRERSGSGNEGDPDGRAKEEERPEWERVLGYSVEGLEKWLCPPRGLAKKRFEVQLDDMVFLGYPVFVREDGRWRKRRWKKGDREGNDSDGEGEEEGGENGMHEETILHEDVTESPSTQPQKDEPEAKGTNIMSLDAMLDPNPVSQSYSSQGGISEVNSEAKSASSNDAEEMTMFNVVFVMNPPALEYHIRIQEMYDNVVKKLSKALKYEQARSGYVWKQAKQILAMVSQGKENKTPMSVLWPKIITESLLAKSLATVYTSISASKIAHVDVNSSFNTSLQIPQAISTPYVPTPCEPQMPGLWLTTASMIVDDESDTALSPHAALLLLEDKETLLKEIESDAKELAGPLAYFIREIKPTKSLQKLSLRIQLSLSDMQFLARHLIYWRRARAIPPLHIRDTYIVSPNADMRQLAQAIPAFGRSFSALPSLPKMLQLLSGEPRPYGRHIPSHDHKQVYLDMLAWLLRGGWVTQLRTFAWVKVAPDIKARCAADMKREKVKLARGAQRREKGSVGSDAAPAASVRRSLAAGSDEIAIGGNDNASDASSGRRKSSVIASPRLTGLLSPPPPKPSSDAGSASSGRTAIPLTAPSPALRPSPLSAVDNAGPSSPPSMPLNGASTGAANAGGAVDDDAISVLHNGPGLDPQPNGAGNANLTAAFEQSVVLSPHEANEEESRWLAEVGKGFEDQELREHWSLLLKYLDGKRALEEIAAREGWKKKKVAALLKGLEGEGVLYVVRHW